MNLINTFISDLKSSSFYKDLGHAANPVLIQVAGSYVYGYETEASDFDITVWVEPESFTGQYGHCWQEFLQYEGKRVEWYYVPANIEEIIDAHIDIEKYNFTLSSLTFIGMAGKLTDNLIIDIPSKRGEALIKRLASAELKIKLLEFSAKQLYLKLTQNNAEDGIEHFYTYISPKHLYRIMLVFYSYLNLPINKQLIGALKNGQEFLQYLPEICEIYYKVEKQIKNKL